MNSAFLSGLCSGLALLCSSTAAWAQQVDAQAAERPAFRANRWQEDWSPLLAIDARTEPLDRLKAIALSSDAWLSLGANLRERAESSQAPALGVEQGADSDLLQRLQVHADLRVGTHWQAFTQLEDVRAYGKSRIGGADRNPLDLRQAFVAYRRDVGAGELKLRAGRQDFALDLQRFVSLRNGPNVRQSFDALWANYETGAWRWIAFLSQPVQYRDARAFDDTSSARFRFDSLRLERQVLGDDELSMYYARYARDDAHFLDAQGDERRDLLDARFAGVQGALDWDLEAMGQRGHVGGAAVRAWAIGALAGYTLAGRALSPRFGLQADAASGDRTPGDGRLETFNPLFPNGYYFNRAGYTGYANLIHLKPSLTLHPGPRVALTGAIGLQWRWRTADAIYLQPSVPLAGTAGQGGRWSGAYAQLKGEWTLGTHLSASLELVHYQVGRAIRQAGGHDSQYGGGELQFTW